jgi:hypothetical protein
LADPGKIETGPPVSDKEKRAALERVLASTTFARSSQLRSLLKHICEMELAGRQDQLTEYQLAVDILARPKDVNLSDDSSVRNRAYELRQRLERYYSTEAADAPIRIDIPRGGYVPVYVRAARSGPRAVAIGPAPAERPRPPLRLIFGIALIAVAVICLGLGWWTGSHLSRQYPPTVLREAWGPLADTHSDMLIAIATNLHMLVRPHISPRPNLMPAPEGLYPLFRQTRPLDSHTRLDMEPAQLSIPLAELSAVATLARTRAAFGGGYEILPESDAPVPAILGRDTIFMGTPINSNAATFILNQQPLTVYTRADGTFVILDRRKPAGEGELFTSQMNGDVSPSLYYALLTVISRTDSNGRPRRIVVATGTGAAACIEAAIEFFCSELHMAGLKRRFADAGLNGFPPNYQVVIRCHAQGVRLMSFEYLMHVIPQKPPTLTP